MFNKPCPIYARRCIAVSQRQHSLPKLDTQNHTHSIYHKSSYTPPSHHPPHSNQTTNIFNPANATATVTPTSNPLALLSLSSPPFPPFPPSPPPPPVAVGSPSPPVLTLVPAGPGPKSEFVTCGPAPVAVLVGFLVVVTSNPPPPLPPVGALSLHFPVELGTAFCPLPISTTSSPQFAACARCKLRLS